MTAPPTVPAPARFVPELGPLLGRLTAPPGTASGLVPLDDIRLALVTELFDLAGAAREFASEGDLTSAVQSLNRHGWLAAWERAVSAAAARVAGRIDARIRSAAAESRLPKRRLQRALLDDEERRGIEVRVGAGGGALVEALDVMEASVRRAGRSDALADAWRAALIGVARRLESAWTSLEDAAAKEEAAWQEDIAQVRAWRRPRWPLWVFTVAVLGAALYCGLLIGGFIAVPHALAPFAEWWWART